MPLPKKKNLGCVAPAGSGKNAHTVQAPGGSLPGALTLPAKPAKLCLLAVPFKVPVSDQRLLIRLPEVTRHLMHQQRLMMVRAAEVLMRNGLSLNKTARTLGLSASWLYTWLGVYRTHGPEGLRPKAHMRKDANTCQFTISLK
jgi:hypothetical protein